MDQEYAVCWHGATWREIPREDIGEDQPRPTRRYTTPHNVSPAFRASQQRATSLKVIRTQHAVESALSDTWTRLSTLAKTANRSESAARKYLKAMIAAGTVETRSEPGAGYTIRWYRRAQRVEVAA